MRKARRTNGQRIRRAHAGNNTAKNIGAAILIVIFLVSITTLVVANIKLKDKNRYDPITNCRSDGAPASLAVLVDVTDPLTPLQKRFIENYLRQDVYALTEGTRVSLGLVSSKEDVRNNIKLGFCKPLEGKEANELYQNPKIVKEKFNQGFFEPLDRTLTELLSASPDNYSPIMESIQSLVAGALIDLPHAQKRLIIISDFLQNSEAFSFYQNQHWEDFEKSFQYNRLGHNLNDTEVILLQLPNKHLSISDLEVLNFWRKYFEIQGAVQVTRKTIGDL